MVQLIEPDAARVYKGAIVKDEAQGGDIGRRAVTALTDNTLYNAVPLIRGLDPRRPEAHVGVMFIEFPDGRGGPDHIRSAKITIDLLRHGINRFYRQSMRVSPIDDAYFVEGRPVAVITGNM